MLPKDHVTGLQVQRNAAILANYNYTRRLTGAIGSVAESTGRNVAYTYDNAWRLTNETISGDPVAANNGNLTYLLDAVANRTSLTSTLATLSNQAFTFDANDRMVADSSDANGNTLASGGKTYTYDFLDRLVSASGGLTLVYDGDGNRVGRGTVRYLIDDQTPLGYTQLAEEVVAGSVTRRYVYGLQRVSQTQGATTSYYLYDGGGTVRSLADTAGAGTDTFAYDAFGNLVARTGSTTNDMLYRGEQFDADLGLYYLRARWYNPVSGRFLTADKYEGDGRMLCCQAARLEAIASYGRIAFAGHHGFSFVGHEPVDLSDPSGNIIFRVVVTLAAERAIKAFVAGSILFLEYQCLSHDIVEATTGQQIDAMSRVCAVLSIVNKLLVAAGVTWLIL